VKLSIVIVICISMLGAVCASAFWHGSAVFLGASSTDAVGVDLAIGLGAQ
jgi:hypothetical protein